MFWSLCFVFSFSFCFAFTPCHHCCCCLLCYIAPHLVLLLLGMVHCSLPCVTVVYYDALISPCVVICHSPSSLTLHCYLLWCVTFALHYYYLLWCVTFTLSYWCLLWFVVPHIVLWLLVVVHHSHLTLLLFVMVCCHLTCTIEACCGSPPLHCCCLLWFIALVMRCCYFFVVVSHPSPCDVIVCYSALPLSILGHEVSCVIFEIKVGFFFFIQKFCCFLFILHFLSLLTFMALFNLVFCFNFDLFFSFFSCRIIVFLNSIVTF